MHPAITQVLKYFAYSHLPENLREKSQPFHDLALQVAGWNPDSPETTVALRKLLEAKDCAVRASLPETVEQAARKGYETINEARAKAEVEKR